MKKILFVSARLPYPMVEGHQIRTFGVLSQLSLENEVHLFSLLRQGEQLPDKNKLTDLCESISGYELGLGFKNNLRAVITSILQSQPLMITRYISRALKNAFLEKINIVKPDIIHLDLLTLAGLLDVIPDTVQVVINEHNIESDLILQKAEGYSSGLMKSILKREYNLLSKFEMKSCRKVDAILACSENDRDEIVKFGVENVHTIPNGVNTNELIPGTGKLNEHFVFLGGMGWYPNKRGMEWFVKFVMPILFETSKNIQIDVVGNPNPEIFIPDIYKDNINILGFVDDFRPIVQNALAMIVPLTVGSGTRLKVLEGMSLGKCIISTQKGAEGINLENNKNVIFADSANEFACAMLDVINNKHLVDEIGKSARESAVTIYDWDVIGKSINKIYQGLN